MLNIAPDFALPLEAVTETIAILARKRSGKSYTAAVMVEEMLKAGAHVVIVDPLGIFFGLRSGADGDPAGGLDILILGGEHADLPIDPTAAGGIVVADMVVGDRLSCVLDLSRQTQEETVAFLGGFLRRLYETNREPLHLVVDEADLVAPQVPGKGEVETLTAMVNIIRRGGVRGLGTTLISQRAAAIAKSVLSQVEVLIVLRMQAANDRKAIDEWIGAHATDEQRREVMESLATLAIGEAWVYAPNLVGAMARVQIRRRETFDTSSTPVVGQTLAAPRALSSLDLGALRDRFTAAIEKAEGEDPAKLREKIADLERRLKAGTAVVTADSIAATPMKPEPEIVRIVDQITVEVPVEVPVLDAETLASARVLAEDTRQHGEELLTHGDQLLTQGEALLAAAAEISAQIARWNDRAEAARVMPIALPTLAQQSRKPAEKAEAAPVPAEPAKPKPKPKGSSQNASEVTAPQQRILNALAAFAAVGLHNVARSNVAVWADTSPGSSGYTNNLGALRSSGLVTYPTPGFLALTPGGAAIAVAPTEVIGSSSDLLEAWCRRLPNPQAKIVRAVYATYPEPLAREPLAERAGASAKSSGYTNNLGALRTLGLVDYPQKGTVAATNLLFPEGLPR